jgi:transcriptional regulator with XRE-family HTH domain
MDQQESPAVARRRLRLALRAIREAASLTQGDVARELKWSLSKVNRFELGEVAISNTDLEALLRLFNVADSARVQELSRQGDIARIRRWWWHDSRFRTEVTAGTIELMQYAGDAKTLYAFHSVLIPGLVQNPAYSAKILELLPGIADETKKVRLEFRARLSEHVFNRPNPPKCMIVIDESVILREVGGPRVMLDQLESLLAASREAKVEIRVLPLAPFEVLYLEAHFVLLEMDDDDAVLYRESTNSDELLADSPEKIVEYRDIVRQMLEKSLSVDRSLLLIEARVAALRSTLGR